MNAKKIAAVALAAATTLSMSVPAFAASTLPGATSSPTPVNKTITARTFVNTNSTYTRGTEEYQFAKIGVTATINLNMNTVPTNSSITRLGINPTTVKTPQNKVVTRAGVTDPSDDTDARLDGFKSYWQIGALNTDNFDEVLGYKTLQTHNGSRIWSNGDAVDKPNKTDSQGRVIEPVDHNPTAWNTVKLTSRKFGRTIYQYTADRDIFNSEAMAYEYQNYVGAFEAFVPLNEYSVTSLVVDSAKVASANTPNADAAAVSAKAALDAAIKAADPKTFDATTGGDVKHDLTVTVNDIRDFHAATATADGSFTAYVKVYDNTSKNYWTDQDVKFTIDSSELAFTDVEDTDYFYNAVVWGVKNGYIAGLTDTEFGPKNDLTREQIAVILYRHAGSPAVTNDANQVFDDIDSLSTESQKAISYLYGKGVIAGKTAVSFQPKETVSRADVVTMLYNYLGKPAGDNESVAFEDVAHGKWYEKAVNWAVAKGVTAGTTETTFSPLKTATRAEGITLIYNALKK